MTGSLGDRLNQARELQFIGRDGEIKLVRDFLTAPDPPYALLYFFGPGGVGKTSLLRQITSFAQQLTMQIVQLDGRNLDPSPAAFLGSIQQQLALSSSDGLIEELGKQRTLLTIDTAEHLFPLEGWLQESFLPQLPTRVYVIIAGRNPPALRWQAAPGWRDLMHVRSLENLSAGESRDFLAQRKVPASEHKAILQFTHGHPLALSLVADVVAQQPDTHFRPEEVPDVVKTLLEQFLQEAPSTNHRAALEAASQIRLVNEPLLQAMLQVADAHPYFEWLRGLSFMDAERWGIFPHDLAREALSTDLRWRNPAWMAELHDRARNYFMAQFRQGNPREQRRVLEEYIFLHRENPVIRPFFEWQSSGAVFTDQYRPDDQPAVLAMIEQHEGAAAAAIAAYWLERQPAGTIVLRSADSETHGVLIQVSLEKTTAEEREIDPGVQAVWRFLQKQTSLRRGETATFFRFWLAKDSYQDVSPVQSRIFLNMVQHYLTTPGLAYTFIPCADAPFWQEVFAFADLHRLPEADFEVDGHTFGVYGHDWRRVPPLNWLALMAERELGDAVESTTDLASQSGLEPVVLDEAAFTAAVRDALRHYASQPALLENPLLNSRLVISRSPAVESPAERAAILLQLLRQTIDQLQHSPREAKCYRALYHTYLQPAPTQEKAAELLDLPFSTYRRHLRQGIEQVVQRLWALELG